MSVTVRSRIIGTWVGLMIATCTLLLGIAPTQAYSDLPEPVDGAADIAGPRIDPIGDDLAVIVEQVGIPADEAILAEKLDPLVDGFDEAAREADPHSYAGLYIDYEPFRVVLLTVSPSSVDRVVEDEAYADLKPYLTVEQVDASLMYLLQIRDEITAAGVKPSYGSDIDIASNSVVLLAAAGTTEQLQRDLPVSLRDDPRVRIDEFVEPVEPQDDQIYGGLRLRIPWPDDGDDNDCTSGYSVVAVDGPEGVLTAGHCMNTAGFAGVELNFKSGWNGTNTDAEWFGTPGLTDMARIADGPGVWRYIEGKEVRSNQHKGDHVCHWGIGLQGYGLPMKCGDIDSIYYAPPWVANATSTFIRVNALCAGGDSGGPWFKGTEAYGVHSGGNELGGLCAYTAINYPLSRFDLDLLLH